MGRFSKKLLTAGAQEGFPIENSLRFDKGSSPYLERTQVDGNQQVFTVSFWLKRGEAISGTIFESTNLVSFTDRDNVSINVLNDTISAGGLKKVGGTTIFNHTVITDAILRDSNTWYHIVVAFDLTDATATDRIKIYVNNELQVLETNSVGTEAMSLNRAGVPFYVGRLGDAATNHHDGYLAEVHLVDGQRLTPSDFGEYNLDTGQWIAKRYTGSHGNNGFYLDFADETDLGKDASGNLSTTEEIIYENDMETAIPTFTTPSWVSQSTDRSISGSNSMRVQITTATGTTSFGLGDTFYAEEGGTISFWWNASTVDNDDGQIYFGSPSGTVFVGIDMKRENQSDMYYYKPASTTTYSLISTGVNTAANTWYKVEYVFDSINFVFKIYNESGTVLFTDSGPHFRQSYDTMYLNDADGQWVFYVDDVVLKQRGKQFFANNLTSDDRLPDTPTNNFNVFNPEHNNNTAVLTEGNLRTDAAATGGNYPAHGNMIVPSGKWYMEYAAHTISGSGQAGFLGIIPYNSTDRTTSRGVYFGLGGSSQWFVRAQTLSGSISTTGSAVGDVMGLAFDMDTGEFWVSKNGVWNGSGDPSAGTNPDGDFLTGVKYVTFSEPYNDASGNSAEGTANFGQDSSFAGLKTRQNNPDENGFGDFHYAPPTGYLALCTANLPAPDANPIENHNVISYTGNGGTQSITGLGFQPDIVWIKSSTLVASHQNYDSIRGTNSRWRVDQNDITTITDGVTSFDADGFSLGARGGSNSNTESFVAWCWKMAGGNTVTNNDGGITSQVSVNQDAGMSMVTYTSDGTGGAGNKVGHGLGVAPEIVIHVTRTDTTTDAFGTTQSSADGADLYMNLSTQDGDYSAANTTTSTTFSQITGVSSRSYLTWVIKEKYGFSQAGTYVGNGLANGPFVTTSFEPAFVLLKNTAGGLGGSYNWVIMDIERNGYNSEFKALYPNLNNVQSTSTPVELYSNGFKVINAGGGDFNISGNTYFYLAFAKRPAKYANAR